MRRYRIPLPSLPAALELFIVLVIALLVMWRSELPPGDNRAQVRFYTRDLEFDYIAWTLNAVETKFSQRALGVDRYVSDETGAELVIEFMQLTRDIEFAEFELRTIYTDPEIGDPELAALEVSERLDEYYARSKYLAPLAESILQAQVAAVLADLGLTVGGQTIPPILYHMTPAPMALIVSPRDVIRQDNNISIQPEMTIEEQVALEEAVAGGLDVSSLVVGIGGVGVYPTMVTRTSNINWLAEVVAHEWLHNYFTLRPLGLSYFSTPALRTMNETSAALAGKEIGALVIERYYPEFVPPPPEPAPPEDEPSPESEPPAEPVFDFRAEMRETRLMADALLADGRVEDAELYMELRRRFFWDNGYRIRKLNQAYFAFYGAYADVPGGAAGEDPVAAAVRDLRAQSPTLKDFIVAISWMNSFEELQAYVAP